MSIFSTLSGTMQKIFRIGKNGATLEYDENKLHVKNYTSTALIPVSIGEPIVSTDATTVNYTEQTYTKKNDLSANAGAGLVGTTDGSTVQASLNTIPLTYVKKNDLSANAGAGTVGTTNGSTVQLSLNSKISSVDLSANTGAGLVGTTDGSTVQLSLNSKISSIDLSANAGAGLVGTTDGSTIQTSLDNIPLTYVKESNLSLSTGATLVSYRYSDVYASLSNLMTLSDVNAPRSIWGRNPVADQAIWDAQIESDLMHRGGLLLAKKSHGIRQNAAVLSVRANSEGGSGFTPQVAGSDDTAVLSAAGALDSVALFTDNYALAYATWEDVATADYTATSCTILDQTTLSNIKLGDFLKTKHGFSCIGIVTGIVGNIVSVQKWVIWATSTVTTPANGIGLYVNPVDKIWGQNTNILFDANSRATRGAIVEYGALNNGVPFFDNVTGVDVIILPSSAYGGGSGVRIRSPNVPARWKYGLDVGGANVANIYMHDTGTLPSQVASMIEDTTSAVGIKFNGRNATSSISFVDINTGLESANITPWGHEGKGGRLTGTLNNGGSPGGARRYLVNNASAMSVILPDPTNRKYGEDYEFVFVGTGAVTFTSSVGTVNGNPSVIVTPATSFESRKGMVGGTSLWYLYK